MPKSALAIYNEAITPHRAARDAARAKADAERRETCNAAYAKLLEELAPHRAAYDVAIGEAYAKYEAVVATANTVYEANVAGARATFDEALTSDEGTANEPLVLVEEPTPSLGPEVAKEHPAGHAGLAHEAGRTEGGIF